MLISVNKQSNKDQTFYKWKILCFLVISKNMLILCNFRVLWGAWPHLHPRVRLWRSWLPAPRLIYMSAYLPKKFKDDICTYYFQKEHDNSPLHGQSISQIHTKRFGVGVEAVWSTPTPTPDSWLAATTPGDSDSDSAPLQQTGLHDAWWLYAATEFVQWSGKVIFD